MRAGIGKETDNQRAERAGHYRLKKHFWTALKPLRSDSGQLKSSPFFRSFLLAVVSLTISDSSLPICCYSPEICAIFHACRAIAWSTISAIIWV
jgi:hypothetical protein